MYIKKILKKDESINIDTTIICVSVLIIFDNSLTGKKPPDEIRLNAKFNESKDLIEKRLSIMKINNVEMEYKKKIFVACFKISELLNEI